jgi:cysteine synthase A
MANSKQNNRSEVRARAMQRCRDKKVLIPTLAQMRDPSLIPEGVKKALPAIDPQAVNSLNLFRITWHNDPRTKGFGGVEHIVLPPELTGVRATIVGIIGKHFPTGAHKVGAAFGCLVPRLVRGEFDPTTQKAVWPSTGNYCRGGVFDSALLGCTAVAILPQEMSKERFDWLKRMGSDIIATPGCESNVKEIFDACWDIKKNKPEQIIFNQFEEFGNYMWHFGVTAPAVEEVFQKLPARKKRFAGWVSATGSAGTLAVGDYTKKKFPGSTITAVEALQCPTLLNNGFGAHRIEGIGDKHIPWIHNSRNTDIIAAIDDEATMRLLRLFNEAAGHQTLSKRGVSETLIKQLPLMGISSICNMLAAIKTARLHELTEEDVLMIPCTDSAEMYQSRVEELRHERGAYSPLQAELDHERWMLGATTDHMRDLNYEGRKAIHNLKYFTWVEQQGRTVEELNRLWDRSFWEDVQAEIPAWDEEITRFNKESGVTY